jgi:hypothetical protein
MAFQIWWRHAWNRFPRISESAAILHYDVAPWSPETVPQIVVEHLVCILHHTKTHVPLGTYVLQQITQLSQITSFLPHYLAQSDCLAADHQAKGDIRLTNAICYP